jgi:hypothetical protein
MASCKCLPANPECNLVPQSSRLDILFHSSLVPSQAKAIDKQEESAESAKKSAEAAEAKAHR